MLSKAMAAEYDRGVPGCVGWNTLRRARWRVSRLSPVKKPVYRLRLRCVSFSLRITAVLETAPAIFHPKAVSFAVTGSNFRGNHDHPSRSAPESINPLFLGMRHGWRCVRAKGGDTR
ncbi:MAG: hypothetical protein HZB26_06400 [Candidatus Hydrogenedentes bacterium]|nr:hypothetical protein [Candidatus Hydrogenedentota bacterium]